MDNFKITSAVITAYGVPVVDVLVEPQGVLGLPLAHPPALPPDAMAAMPRPVRPAPKPASTAVAVKAWALCIPAGLPGSRRPVVSPA